MPIRRPIPVIHPIDPAGGSTSYLDPPVFLHASTAIERSCELFLLLWSVIARVIL